MDEVRACADARHARQTTLRYEQQPGPTEPARQGRFGRAPETPTPPVTDASTPTTEPDDRPTPIDARSYVVDPDAVARAILDRLIAGRTLDPPRG